MAAYLSPYSVGRHVCIPQSLGVTWKVFLAYPILLDSLILEYSMAQSWHPISPVTPFQHVILSSLGGV